ncbi:MAG TPA: hypothetical protein VN436_01495 [Holophaga sp.]|nr:hypothetical protein [Holophaga sp.]
MMPGSDEAARIERGWTGPTGRLAPERGLHDHQLRDIPIVRIGAVPLLGGPRPPCYAWHGHPGRSPRPHVSMDERKVVGNGVYLFQRHGTAVLQAGRNGEVLACCVDTAGLVALGLRQERTYPARETAALELPGCPDGLRGWDLLFRLNHLHGSGAGLTAFLRRLGFNAVAYGATSRGEGGWCLFDPHLLRRSMRTSGWSAAEIDRREACDPDVLAEPLA